MKIKIGLLVFVFYTSIALDSLLKVNFGLKVHLGLFFILICNVLFFLKDHNRFFTGMKNDKAFFFFVVYCFISGYFYSAAGFYQIFIYLLMATNLCLFVYFTASHWNYRVFYAFQWLLIITGIIQFLVYKIFGYQITFIDAEHYMKGSSVSGRLRGFFIEPNWYAIAISFNTFLLFGKDIIKYFYEHKITVFLTFIAMILNGTFATLGIVLIFYMIPLIKSNPVKGVSASLACILIFSGVFAFRGGLSEKDSFFNHSSRLLPIVRVLEFQDNKSFFDNFFGNGLGSWGTDAVYNRLSVLVYEEKASARDGSETAVILFELGYIGLLMVLIDSLVLLFKSRKVGIHFAGGIVLFIVCLIFYPIFKFVMYMPYYFIIRYKVKNYLNS
jgi:hypothetical protein